LALSLALVAYRGLLSFEPAIHLSAEVEEFFFDPSYTSPRAVLALSLWLLYRRRERLRRLPLGAGSPGPAAALLAAGVSVLAWSTYTGAPDLLALSLSLNVLGVGALLRGPRAIRVLAVPAAFLLLAIPVPSPLLNHVLFPLQLATANYTGWMLQGLGVPVYVLGDQILGSEANFVVIEGCSGMRSIESLTLIAILLVDLFRRTGLHALLILLAAPGVAFGLNGLRAVTLVLNPHSEIVAIHNLQGILILLAGLITLYLLDGFLARKAPGRAAGGILASRPLASRGRGAPAAGRGGGDGGRCGAVPVAAPVAAGLAHLGAGRAPDPGRTGWLARPLATRGLDVPGPGWLRPGGQPHLPPGAGRGSRLRGGRRPLAAFAQPSVPQEPVSGQRLERRGGWGERPGFG
jgi:exosortase